MTGPEPDNRAAGNGSRGSCGVLRLSGSVPMVRCYPVRAVPLAAVIPSRVPAVAGGHGAGPRQNRRSGGVNQAGARAGDGGADRLATSRLAAGQESYSWAGPAGRLPGG